DDEIPGEDDEQQHGNDGNGHDGIQVVAELGAGVAPVDTDVDVVGPGGLVLVAVVGQDLVQIPLNVPGAALQHHVQVPGAGHAVGGAGGIHAHLGQDGVHPALRNQDVAGHDGLVPLPPAGEGEGLG